MSIEQKPIPQPQHAPEQEGAHGSEPQRRPRIEFGGSVDKEGKLASTELPVSDMMSPAGAIVNVFRELGLDKIKTRLTEEQLKTHIKKALEETRNAKPSSQKDKEAQERLIEHLEAVETINLPMLKNAVGYWTGNSAMAEGITLDGLHNAFQAIEHGDRVPLLCASALMKYTNLSPEKGRLAVEVLAGSKKFDRVVQTLLAYNSDDMLTTEESQVVHEKIVSDIAAILTQRGVIDAPHLLWRDTEPTLDDLIQAKNRARKQAGSGLNAVVNRLLNKTYLPPKEGERAKNAYTLILENHGPGRLISDQLTTALQGARRFYTDHAPQQGILALDIAIRDRHKAVSLGSPISTLFAAISPDYQDMIDADPQLRERVLNESLSTLRERMKTFPAVLGRLLGKQVPPEIDEAVAHIADAITSTQVEEAYKETAKAAKKKAAGIIAIDGAPPHPDEFARQQKIFTDFLLASVRESGKTFVDHLKEFSGLTEIHATGLWRDEDITRALRSSDLESDEGEKRLRVEGFLERLMSVAKGVDVSANYTDAEKYLIKLAAEAIYEIAHDLRVERQKAESKKKTTAIDTARLYRNYAEVFRIYTNSFKILPPLPGEYVYPAQEADESHEQYQERLREFIREREKKDEGARRAFQEQQQATVIAHLHTLVQRLTTDDNLEHNFVGSLWRILNKSGKELKTAIREKMRDIEHRPVPPAKPAAEAIDPLSSLTPAMRTDIERLLSTIEKIEMRIKETPTALKELEFQLNMGLNMDLVPDDFRLLKTKLDRYVTPEIHAINALAKKYRTLAEGTAEYKATRSAVARADSVLAWHDTIKNEFERVARILWRKMLYAESASLANALKNSALTGSKKKRLQERLDAIERNIALQATAIGLEKRRGGIANTLSRLQDDLAIKTYDPNTSDAEREAIAQAIRESEDALKHVGAETRKAWSKAMEKYYAHTMPAFRSPSAKRMSQALARLEEERTINTELLTLQEKAMHVYGALRIAENTGDSAGAERERAALEALISQMESLEENLATLK